MDKSKKCKICSNEFSYINGDFTRHIRDTHNITLKEYTLEYDINKIPTCECGCGLLPDFYRGKFKRYCICFNYKF